MKVDVMPGRQYFLVDNSRLFLLLLPVLLLTWFFRYYFADDAFISFRYIQNLLEGKGLVYNAGERIWGFSNFLWIVILLPFARAGADLLLVSRIAGVICNIFTASIVFWGLRYCLRSSMKPNYLGIILLVTNGAFILQSMGGLETSFYTFLILSAIRFLDISSTEKKAGGLYLFGIMMALVALTRPEGVLLFFFLLVLITSMRRSFPLPAVQSVSRPLLIFLPVVLSFTVSMFFYYGSLWPNSINAKVGLSLEQVLRGFHYALVFIIRYPINTILIAMALCFWKRASAMVKIVVSITLFIFAFNILAGGDWMHGYRLFHTFIPLSCLLVPFCLTSLGNALTGFNNRALAAFLPKAIIAIFVILNLLNCRIDPRVYSATKPSYVHDGIKIGVWMRDNFREDALLATNTGGSLAYFSSLPVVDMMGINDEVIASRRNLPEGWKGIEKGDGQYVLSRRPDYIHFASSTGSAKPLFLSDIEIYKSEEFWRNYDLVEYVIDKQTKLLIYKRREGERLDPLSPGKRAEIQRTVNERMANSAFRY